MLVDVQGVLVHRHQAEQRVVELGDGAPGPVAEFLPGFQFFEVAAVAHYLNRCTTDRPTAACALIFLYRAQRTAQRRPVRSRMFLTRTTDRPTAACALTFLYRAQRTAQRRPARSLSFTAHNGPPNGGLRAQTSFTAHNGPPNGEAARSLSFTAHNWTAAQRGGLRAHFRFTAHNGPPNGGLCAHSFTAGTTDRPTAACATQPSFTPHSRLGPCAFKSARTHPIAPAYSFRIVRGGLV